MMNDSVREIEYLIGWYGIKRKYYSGLALVVIGTIILIINLILLYLILPYGILYHHSIIIYNGSLIRYYVGITMGSIGSILLLIGLPLLITSLMKKTFLTKPILLK